MTLYFQILTAAEKRVVGVNEQIFDTFIFKCFSSIYFFHHSDPRSEGNPHRTGSPRYSSPSVFLFLLIEIDRICPTDRKITILQA